MATEAFDALVIGGGPAGAAAALLLARVGWSVALLERSVFPRHKVCGEFLSAANLPLLRHLGVAEAFCELGGPPVRRVGVFAGAHALISDMPGPRPGAGVAGETGDAWGRALGRDHLDTLLLERAAAAGAQVWQPWSATAFERDRETNKDGYVCTALSRNDSATRSLRARIVIAAHGSWEPGALPTQPKCLRPRPSDLFGFKAHFLGGRLPDGLMPLLAFPGGYGGLVHSDHGRISLSCCIRRDALDSVRRTGRQEKAADAVLAHIAKSCRAAGEVLAGAQLEHGWLSAGPIRPGIRGCGSEGFFLAGNAAGEAHPVIAEGIGMALQSAALLAECLSSLPAGGFSSCAIDQARTTYSAAWRRLFAPRIRAAALIAQWAMRPMAVSCAMPLLRRFPSVLTAGAWLSGKAA